MFKKVSPYVLFSFLGIPPTNKNVIYCPPVRIAIDIITVFVKSEHFYMHEGLIIGPLGGFRFMRLTQRTIPKLTIMKL